MAAIGRKSSINESHGSDDETKSVDGARDEANATLAARDIEVAATLPLSPAAVSDGALASSVAAAAAAAADDDDIGSSPPPHATPRQAPLVRSREVSRDLDTLIEVPSLISLDENDQDDDDGGGGENFYRARSTSATSMPTAMANEDDEATENDRDVTVEATFGLPTPKCRSPSVDATTNIEASIELDNLRRDTNATVEATQPTPSLVVEDIRRSLEATSTPPPPPATPSAATMPPPRSIDDVAARAEFIERALTLEDDEDDDENDENDDEGDEATATFEGQLRSGVDENANIATKIVERQSSEVFATFEEQEAAKYEIKDENAIVSSDIELAQSHLRHDTAGNDFSNESAGDNAHKRSPSIAATIEAKIEELKPTVKNDEKTMQNARRSSSPKREPEETLVLHIQDATEPNRQTKGDDDDEARSKSPVALGEPEHLSASAECVQQDEYIGANDALVYDDAAAIALAIALEEEEKFTAEESAANEAANLTTERFAFEFVDELCTEASTVAAERLSVAAVRLPSFSRQSPSPSLSPSPPPRPTSDFGDENAEVESMHEIAIEVRECRQSESGAISTSVVLDGRSHAIAARNVDVEVVREVTTEFRRTRTPSGRDAIVANRQPLRLRIRDAICATFAPSRTTTAAVSPATATTISDADENDEQPEKAPIVAKTEPRGDKAAANENEPTSTATAASTRSAQRRKQIDETIKPIVFRETLAATAEPHQYRDVAIRVERERPPAVEDVAIDVNERRASIADGAEIHVRRERYSEAPILPYPTADETRANGVNNSPSSPPASNSSPLKSVQIQDEADEKTTSQATQNSAAAAKTPSKSTQRSPTTTRSAGGVVHDLRNVDETIERIKREPIRLNISRPLPQKQRSSPTHRLAAAVNNAASPPPLSQYEGALIVTTPTTMTTKVDDDRTPLNGYPSPREINGLYRPQPLISSATTTTKKSAITVTTGDEQPPALLANGERASSRLSAGTPVRSESDFTPRTLSRIHNLNVIMECNGELKGSQILRDNDSGISGNKQRLKSKNFWQKF